MEENKITNTEENIVNEEVKEPVTDEVSYNTDNTQSKEETFDAIDVELQDILSLTSVTDDENNEIEENAEERKDNKKKKHHKKHYKGLKALILAIIIISISVGLAYFIIRVGMDLMGINKSEELIYVEIPQGASTEQIATILKDEEIIESEWGFRLFSKLTHADGKYQFGSFELKPSYTYEAIIDKLTTENSAVNIIDVTLPEGKTLNDIAKVLEEKGVCSKNDLIKAAEEFSGDYKFMSKIHITTDIYYKSEGYLFPDTYTFYLDEDPKSVVDKFFTNFDNKMTDDMYAKMDELGLSLNQLISLASLIQGESASDEQMKEISSVFWNRLNEASSFPLLQSDVTTKYIDNDLKQVIAASKYDKYQTMFNGYDTYSCIGLPAGPVNNPGIKAIEAALYPADTNYYYFCHNIATGEVYYASTLDQHNYNLYLAGLR